MTENAREIAELLPFLANETLTGEERARVEAAVAADPALQAELAALRRIRAEMQAAPAPAHSPGELGLRRLMRRLDEEAPAPQVAAPRAAGPGLWRIAAVVALALLAAQSALFWSGGGGPDVELAGDAPVAARGPALTVAFVEDAPEGAIRALLLELRLEIVGGPSALGLYRLAAQDEAGAEAALAALRARPALIDDVARE